MTDPLTAADLYAIEQRLKDSNGLGDYPCCDEYTEDYIGTLAASASDVPALVAEVRRLRAMEQRVREYARHLARPFADGVPDREGEQIASELLAALDGGE